MIEKKNKLDNNNILDIKETSKLDKHNIDLTNSKNIKLLNNLIFENNKSKKNIKQKKINTINPL